MDTVDWPGLLADLRDSWQSPLFYLQKRGYLPPVNENLLQQKLNELRAIKVSEPSENCNLYSEKVGENIGAETSGAAASFSGSTANEMIPSKIDFNNPLEDINAFVTYASQQQKTQESVENLLNDLSNDVLEQPNADAEAEADFEFDEDSDSFRNGIANAGARKPPTGGSKSKPKYKCKLKSKSKSQPKSRPGFFQRLKQKLSSIFTKSKGVDSKRAPIKMPTLSADYANYFVKYLAPHRDMSTGSNTLSVNDLNGQYAGINSCSDWEKGGKGLYRRDHSASKDKHSTVGDLSGKEAALKSIESNDLGADVAKLKDISPEMFPFKDFNLGDLSAKKLKTKDTSSQTDDAKNTDLKNFNSKDEELNKIVHSLAEQQPTAKDMNSIKSEKSESKDDFNLNELSFSKGLESALPDNINFKDKDVNDFNLKETVGEINIDNNGKNSELPSYKDISTNNVDLGDLKMPNFNIKTADSKAKTDVDKNMNLNDADFSMPDLPDSGWKNSLAHPSSSDAFSKDVVSAKDFGNLGMPSLKLKILESNARQAAAAAAMNDETEEDSDQRAVNGFDTKNNDYSMSAGLSQERNINNFDVRQQDMPNMSAKNSNENLNHVAAKGTNMNNFDIGELSTKLDDNNLDIDRQFTRQVLEKVMRSSAKAGERGER